VGGKGSKTVGGEYSGSRPLSSQGDGDMIFDAGVAVDPRGLDVVMLSRLKNADAEYFHSATERL
jgi:hypothetical protein